MRRQIGGKAKTEHAMADGRSISVRGLVPDEQTGQQFEFGFETFQLLAVQLSDQFAYLITDLRVQSSV